MAKNAKTNEGRLTGGRAVARTLVDNGVTDVFGVHGYINGVLEEACMLGVRNHHFRHEQSAGFAADAYGRLTRKTGVCYASAAAGMANYLGPLSQGYGALSPMLLLVGSHPPAVDGLHGMQEGYAVDCFRTVTKWSKRLTDWELNSYWTQKALRDTVSFPPAPICLELPINVDRTFGPEPQRKYSGGNGNQPRPPVSAADPSDVEKVVELLLAAEKPIIIAGDGVYWSDAAAELRDLAHLLKIPTNTRRTARGAVSEEDDFGMASSVRGPLMRDADLIVLIGLRASELESWFEAPDWPRGVKYVQINENAEELWYPLPTEVLVAGNSKMVLRQILSGARAELGETSVDRAEWVAKLHTQRERNGQQRSQLLERYSNHTPIHTFELTEVLMNIVDHDATIIYDSYSGSLYLTDAVKARFAGQVLDAGYRVALGQGIGMAIGAAVARPGKQIVTLVGDGGMGIAATDIETMIHYNLPCIVVVLNNSSWGGAALGGSDFFPNIDWSVGKNNRWDLAFQALGAHGEFVERSEDLAPAMKRAIASGKPAVVNVVADCDGTEYSQMWLKGNLGMLYARGTDELNEDLRSHYRGASPISALRMRKQNEDWGTHVPLSFVADLTDNSVEELELAAEKTGYTLPENEG